MPEDNSPDRLEWNEDNLATVLSELYRESENNEALRGQLFSDPFAVLSGRIVVPEEYRGGIFVREKGGKVMMLYPPAVTARQDALPEGTTVAEPQKDFEPICTTTTIW